MDIAILGGSFDPPHRGHVAIVNRLLSLKYFDEIWLMPCYQHPFSKRLSNPNRRFEMTKCIENEQIKICDLEIKNKTTNYTIDALELLADKYPQHKFSWIIGTDQIKDFTKWRDWKEIINKFGLITVPRAKLKTAELELKNIAKQVKKPENIVLINKKNFLPIYISSTLIRKKIKENKSISGLVPKKIETYIIQHNLYK
jgi:nicotinate-nucleotide adenylyltransferase